MKTCKILTASDLLYVSAQGFQSSVHPSQRDSPILVAPSLTLRKHFQIPGDLEQDERTVQMEVFSRFVPGSIEDFHCQFVTHLPPGKEKTAVLGLAVKKQRIEEIREPNSDVEEIFFFERLLAARSLAERTLITIPFDGGIYYAVFEQTTLWSRYVNNPTEKSRQQTLQHIENEYPGIEHRRDLPDFPETEEVSSEWSRAILDLLPESPAKEWNLITPQQTSAFTDVGWRSWSLVGVLILALASWMGTNLYAQQKYKGWIEESFQNQFNRAPRYPLEELQAQLKRARGAQKDSQNNISPKFPRLSVLDSALAEQDLRVLRISLANNAGSMVFLSPSLEAAETYLKKLRTNDRVRSVRIQSTDSRSRGPYRFEVNIKIQWSS